jgi:hypothetical protein
MKNGRIRVLQVLWGVFAVDLRYFDVPHSRNLMVSEWNVRIPCLVIGVHPGYHVGEIRASIFIV